MMIHRLLVASALCVALVSNEFGELGIDAALLGRMQDDYVELRGVDSAGKGVTERFGTLLRAERITPTASASSSGRGRQARIFMAW